MFKMPTMGLDNSHIQKKPENSPAQYRVSTPVFGLGQAGAVENTARHEVRSTVEKASNTEKKSKPEKKVKESKAAAPVEEAAPKPEKKAKPPKDPNAKSLRDYLTEGLSEVADGLTSEELYARYHTQIRSPKPGYKQMLDKMENVQYDATSGKYRLVS